MRYSKYQKLVKMVSYDNGQTWEVSSPIEYSVGDLIETNSPDCGYQPIYRWTTIEDDFVCVGTIKCAKEVRQVSYDDGETWENVEPLETRTGPSIEANSFDCGYIEYRWEPVENEFYCEDDNKYNKLVYQQTTDGTNWTDVEPAEYQKGELIEYNSDDCGWTEEEIANFYNEKGLEVPTYDEVYVQCRCGTFTVGSAKLISPTRLKLTITPDWNKTYVDQCGTKFYFLRYNTPFYSSPAIPTAVKDTSNFTLSYQLNKEPLNNNEGYYTFMLKLDNPSSSATDGAITTIKVYEIMQEQKSDNASEYEELYSMPFFAINKDNEVFFIAPQYRWVDTDEYVCDGNSKYVEQIKQVTYDGTNWSNVTPVQYQKGDLIEEYSTDCGYVAPTRWIDTDDFICDGWNKYVKQIKQSSPDNGTTWVDVVPEVSQKGDLIEENSDYCYEISKPYILTLNDNSKDGRWWVKDTDSSYSNDYAVYQTVSIYTGNQTPSSSMIVIQPTGVTEIPLYLKVNDKTCFVKIYRTMEGSDDIWLKDIEYEYQDNNIPSIDDFIKYNAKIIYPGEKIKIIWSAYSGNNSHTWEEGASILMIPKEFDYINEPCPYTVTKRTDNGAVIPDETGDYYNPDTSLYREFILTAYATGTGVNRHYGRTILDIDTGDLTSIPIYLQWYGYGTMTLINGDNTYSITKNTANTFSLESYTLFNIDNLSGNPPQITVETDYTSGTLNGRLLIPINP